MFQDYVGFHPDVVHLILAQHPDWCDDPKTSQVETCDEQVARSFDRAVAQLEKAFGPPGDGWRWGIAHTAAYTHSVWSKIPIAVGLLNYRFAADGSTDTINNAAVFFRNEPAPFQSFFGSTLRMTVDLAKLDETRFMMVPGQSGNPISKHYNDLIADWQQHRWIQFQK